MKAIIHGKTILPDKEENFTIRRGLVLLFDENIRDILTEEEFAALPQGSVNETIDADGC